MRRDDDDAVADQDKSDESHQETGHETEAFVETLMRMSSSYESESESISPSPMQSNVSSTSHMRMQAPHYRERSSRHPTPSLSLAEHETAEGEMKSRGYKKENRRLEKQEDRDNTTEVGPAMDREGHDQFHCSGACDIGLCECYQKAPPDALEKEASTSENPAGFNVLPRLSFTGRSSFVPLLSSPSLDQIMELIDIRAMVPLYLQAFRELLQKGMLNRKRGIILLKYWREVKIQFGGNCDPTHGLFAEVQGAFWIADKELGSPSSILDGAVSDAERRRLWMSHANRLGGEGAKRLRESAIFKQLNDGSRAIRMECLGGKERRLVVNDVYLTYFRRPEEFMKDAWARRCLIDFLLAATVVPDDRPSFFRELVQGTLGNPGTRQTGLFKALDRHAQVNLFLFENRVVELSPGEFVSLIMFEPAPPSRHIPPQHPVARTRPLQEPICSTPSLPSRASLFPSRTTSDPPFEEQERERRHAGGRGGASRPTEQEEGLVAGTGAAGQDEERAEEEGNQANESLYAAVSLTSPVSSPSSLPSAPSVLSSEPSSSSDTALHPHFSLHAAAPITTIPLPLPQPPHHFAQETSSAQSLFEPNLRPLASPSEIPPLQWSPMQRDRPKKKAAKDEELGSS